MCLQAGLVNTITIRSPMNRTPIAPAVHACAVNTRPLGLVTMDGLVVILNGRTKAHHASIGRMNLMHQ
jgi:hypothetical protein